MDQKKPKSLSDVARANNERRVSKFANSIVPKAPQVTPEPVQDVVAAMPSISPEPAPAEEPAKTLTNVIEQGENDFAAGKGVVMTADDLKAATKTDPAPAAGKPVRKRSTSALTMDDIVQPKVPDEEVFGKMTRISAKHHKLLRILSLEYDVNMNTMLYNLLEQLDQAFQRDRQKDA
jgi:hypothetical protein